jgi:hypothetical protein
MTCHDFEGQGHVFPDAHGQDIGGLEDHAHLVPQLFNPYPGIMDIDPLPAQMQTDGARVGAGEYGIVEAVEGSQKRAFA